MKCPRCGGSGEVEDEGVLGMKMRVLRKDAGVTLREMARRIGVSASYLSDLELGRRRWSPRFRSAYEARFAPLEPRRRSRVKAQIPGVW